jgi:hypothetical protein
MRLASRLCLLVASLAIAAHATAQPEDGPYEPTPLDPFVLYQAKTSAAGEKFYRFGPVLLSDAFQSNATLQVRQPAHLAVPASVNGAVVNDPSTHREEYLVKPRAGAPRFERRSDVRVVNACNDLLLTVVKPVSLLVPTATSFTEVPAEPVPMANNVEHFLCYRAYAQTRLADGTRLPPFPRGIQVDATDGFQTRRYDLLKITKLCNPVDKAGTPVLQAGPGKGLPKPITTATRVADAPQLVCYRARMATSFIPQTGCGPTTPGDTGTKIEPRQGKHLQVAALFVANQFGPERLDTIVESEICIPSQIAM